MEVLDQPVITYCGIYYPQYWQYCLHSRNSRFPLFQEGIPDISDEEDMLPEEVGNASIQFFKMIHSISEKLSQIMKRKCDKMIRKDCSKIHLSILPPSPTPTYYHRICVYHQMKVWKILCDTDWSLYRGVEILVMTPLSL